MSKNTVRLIGYIYGVAHLICSMIVVASVLSPIEGFRGWLQVFGYGLALASVCSTVLLLVSASVVELGSVLAFRVYFCWLMCLFLITGCVIWSLL